MRRHFLVHITVVLRQCSLEHEIGLIARLFPVSALYCALERELRSVNDFRRKTQFVAFQFSGLEELVQKRSLVALLVSKSRDEASDASRVFHGQLNKFAFFQERIHSRICLRTFAFGWWRGLLRGFRSRVCLRRLRNQIFRSREDSRSDHAP